MTLEEGCKLIPAGATLLIRSTGWVQRLIQFFGLKFERWDSEDKCNHDAKFFGIENQFEIIEANGGRIKQSSIIKFLGPKTKVYVYININLTPENLREGYECACDNIGKWYDFAEFFKFVLPWLKESPHLNVCSSFSRMIDERMKLPVPPLNNKGLISPMGRKHFYDDTKEAYDGGWRLVQVWDKEWKIAEGDSFKPLNDI